MTIHPIDAWHQVVAGRDADRLNDLLADVETVERMNAEPVEKRQCRLNPSLVVRKRTNSAVAKFGSQRLSEVVANGSEHHGNLFSI